ncbi:MAG: hypothetical protein QM607_08050 [Microbacterium sp.]
MTTVAENLVPTLKANGVDRVYGRPGDSLNGFTDALRTLMSGRGDEVLDVARTNWRQLR